MNYVIELLAQNESELDIKINEYVERGYQLISKECEYETIREEYLGIFGPIGFVKYRKGMEYWKAIMEFNS